VSIILYRLFIWLYKWGAVCLSPFNKKARCWLAGRKNVFQRLQVFAENHTGKTIWFHCASLGEFEQGRPLLETIKSRYPEYKIVLTFFSPSGYEIRKNYEAVDCVVYLPADTASHARKLLQLLKPALVIWVKYDYWYFYLQEIKKNNTPLLLISGIFRKEQPFFKWYGNLHRKMLSCFTGFFVQNDESKILLGTLGFSENVTISGDTRFDRVIEIAEQFRPIPIVEAFINGAPAVVAGSTWEEDEEELDHFANTHPEIKFIIAPHEIDEEHLKDIAQLFHHTVRYSNLSGSNQNETSSKTPAANVLIIDNIGMLARLYKYATIAYIGGGFGADGIHNILEAAVYGKPVVFGPVYEKYAEAEELIDNGGAFDIENSLELEETLQMLLENGPGYKAACEASHRYVYTKKGATEKILQHIQENRLLTSW
jgi:3-deoxy-D-manno-octulosonic-acid transferase